MKILLRKNWEIIFMCVSACCLFSLNAENDLGNCLTNADTETCKYAAFAIGNLLFHDETFYGTVHPKHWLFRVWTHKWNLFQLSFTIEPLIRLLDSSSITAQVNAAGVKEYFRLRLTIYVFFVLFLGALGNMARHSLDLDSELRLHNAPERFIVSYKLIMVWSINFLQNIFTTWKKTFEDSRAGSLESCMVFSYSSS